MKYNNRFCKCLASSSLVLALAALAWLPDSAQAQEEKGAQRLMKIQTVEDLGRIEVGDTILMSCPKCKDTYTQVVTPKSHAAMHDEVSTGVVHLAQAATPDLLPRARASRPNKCLSTPAKPVAARTPVAV